MRKAKQEVMRRYHPDKHQQVYPEEEKYKLSMFIDSINEICRITNRVVEAITAKGKK